ncbi:MAG TPA: TonB-dependent receptor [Acetobacteraceae bacterium]|jgi:outer membrane receptor protein involved in Fe transport|nr:TonB-dependent receptor [Acetobacteraceae bacterium]
MRGYALPFVPAAICAVTMAGLAHAADTDLASQPATATQPASAPQTAAASQPQAAPQPNPASQANGNLSMDIDVVSKRLDVARQQIQPSLGATTYTFTPDALSNIPQGENAPLNQVLLQAPGVAQDSFGQIHLRGEHANVQYRLNGVELPEGLSVFGQAIESRFAQSLSLITGALPAQYGFQTAGVVDIQTKTGISNPGLTLSMYGGSWNWLEPSMDYGGRSGPVDYFITVDGLHNDRGIENPTSSFSAIHDTTNQFHGLAYVSGIIDPDTRISLIVGGFDGNFQIPNNPGQSTLPLNVNGTTTFNSANLNENQSESTFFGVLSLQKHIDTIDLQISVFNRTSTLHFTPDGVGDLLFNGIAQQASRQDVASGLQSDGSWRINDQHTLRAGFLAQLEQGSSDTLSSVLPVNAAGVQTSTTPLLIADNQNNSGGLYGLYLQDEWRLLPTLTLNYGARFDMVEEFTHESQLSPRANLVWKPVTNTTLHIGYARYFVPPPYEALAPGSIANFQGTTAAPQVTQDNTVRAERSNYFDVGASQVLIPGLTVGVDAYYKISKNLIDEGQFGAPIILTAFNYAQGIQTGVELTASYDRGPLSLYGNLAWSRAMGKDINSAQFNFSAADLAFIQNNFIHLDHDQTWSGSAGAAYVFNSDSPYPTRVSADLLVQSGLRASTATIPNGVALPSYATGNLSIVQTIATGTDLRLDVLNIADNIYEIRNGTGVGVGAPQFGIRRTILAGITHRF